MLGGRFYNYKIFSLELIFRVIVVNQVRIWWRIWNGRGGFGELFPEPCTDGASLMSFVLKERFKSSKRIVVLFLGKLFLLLRVCVFYYHWLNYWDCLIFTFHERQPSNGLAMTNGQWFRDVSRIFDILVWWGRIVLHRCEARRTEWCADFSHLGTRKWLTINSPPLQVRREM